MIKALIIDDEQHCIEELLYLLKPYKGSIKVLAHAQTIEQGMSLIQEFDPDLVFLDIQIGDKSGFDLIQKISPLFFDVIFTTAYDKYAVEAFKFSALDYLLKPIESENLKRAIEKYHNKSTVRFLEQKIDVLTHNLKSLDTQKKITVPTSEGYEFLEIPQIIRFQSDINYTDIYLKSGKKITVSKTLKSFEELLEPAQFFRVHNSHLINLRLVKKYIKGKGGYVIMDDNTNIEVSTRRKEGLLSRLKFIY